MAQWQKTNIHTHTTMQWTGTCETQQIKEMHEEKLKRSEWKYYFPKKVNHTEMEMTGLDCLINLILIILTHCIGFASVLCIHSKRKVLYVDAFIGYQICMRNALSM